MSLPYICVDDRDNVAIILHPEGFTAREHIPQSNKIALKDFETHEPVIRYGHVIGYAAGPIPQGSWIRPEMLDLPEAPSLDQLPLATAFPRLCRLLRATRSRLSECRRLHRNAKHSRYYDHCPVCGTDRRLCRSSNQSRDPAALPERR